MINILYTVDEGFAPQLAAAMQSVINQHTDNQIHFFVFAKEFTDETAHKLAAYIRENKQRLTIIDISNFKNDMGFDYDTKGWDDVILARLMMARYLPEDTGRVLYLDADTMVRANLEPLWNKGLQGKTVALGLEPTCSKKRRANLGLGYGPYYNSGVILVDLNKWKQARVEQNLLAYCKSHTKLVASDQDAINVVLKDEIAPLSLTYNYANSFDYYPFSFLEKKMPQLKVYETESSAIISNPAIVHFLGEERPWRKGSTHRFASEYLDNLYKTPWKNTPMEGGWEGYFKAWALFNRFMKHFPALRLWIINSLIPLFMKLRTKQRINKNAV